MSGLIGIIAALAAQTAASGGTAPAQTSDKSDVGASTYLDIEAGAGYSSNPLQAFGSGTGAGLGRIALHGVHTRQSERSTTVLSAYAQNLVYTNHYRAEQAFDLNARHSTAVSERVRLFGDLDASYDKGGQLDTRLIGVPDVNIFPGTPGTPPALLPPGTDFLAITGKHYRLYGDVGAQIALSARDSLTMSTGAERVSYRAAIDSDYTTVFFSTSFDRQLSPRTTVGAQVTADNTNYNGPSNSRVITPRLTARFLLSAQTTLSGGVGASFASIDNGIRTRHTTGLSADTALCHKGEHDSLCARAAIDQETATVAGPLESISGGVDYSRQLNANDSIQLSLGVNRYSNRSGVTTSAASFKSTYYRAAASYTRRLGNRWFGGADLFARKLAEAGPDPKGDVGGSLFIRYRLGDLQ